MRRLLNEAHPQQDFARDSLRVRHRLEGRHVLGQVLFMNASKRPQERPQRRAYLLATVAMHLADALSPSSSRAHSRRPFSSRPCRTVLCAIPIFDSTRAYPPHSSVLSATSFAVPPLM